MKSLQNNQITYSNKSIENIIFKEAKNFNLIVKNTDLIKFVDNELVVSIDADIPFAFESVSDLERLLILKITEKIAFFSSYNVDIFQISINQKIVKGK